MFGFPKRFQKKESRESERTKARNAPTNLKSLTCTTHTRNRSGLTFGRDSKSLGRHSSCSPASLTDRSCTPLPLSWLTRPPESFAAYHLSASCWLVTSSSPGLPSSSVWYANSDLLLRLWARGAATRFCGGQSSSSTERPDVTSPLLVLQTTTQNRGEWHGDAKAGVRESWIAPKRLKLRSRRVQRSRPKGYHPE